MHALPLLLLVMAQVPADAPSAWSCSVETLTAGRECVFDAKTPTSTDKGAQERHNIELARELAPAVCEGTTRAKDAEPLDPQLRAMCIKRITEAAQQCGLKGERPLVDEKGRFVQGSRECYRAMAAVAQAIPLLSTAVTPCCRCLARTGCSSAGEACYERVAEGRLDARESACSEKQCSEACTPLGVRTPKEAHR